MRTLLALPQNARPRAVSDNCGTLRCISVPEAGLRSSELNKDRQSIRSVRRSGDAGLIQMNKLDRRVPESCQGQVSAKSSTALLYQLEIGVPDSCTEMIAIGKNIMSGITRNVDVRAVRGYALSGISRNLLRHTLNADMETLTASEWLLSRLFFQSPNPLRDRFSGA